MMGGRKRWLKRGGTALLLSVVVGMSLYIFFLPLVTHHVIRSKLDSLGLSDIQFELRQFTARRLVLADVTLGDTPPSRIDRVEATFSVRDQRVRELDVIGMQLRIRRTDTGWQVDSLSKLKTGEGDGSALNTLPFDTFRLRSSTLIIVMDSEELRIPIEAEVDATQNSWRVHMTLWPNGAAVILDGEVTPLKVDDTTQYAVIAKLTAMKPGRLSPLMGLDSIDLAGLGAVTVELQGNVTADAEVSVDAGSLRLGSDDAADVVVVRMPNGQTLRLSGIAGEAMFRATRAATGDVSLTVREGASLHVSTAASPGAKWHAESVGTSLDQDETPLLSVRTAAPITFNWSAQGDASWSAICDRIIVTGGADHILWGDDLFLGPSVTLDVVAGLSVDTEGAQLSLASPASLEIADALLPRGIAAKEIQFVAGAHDELPALAIRWADMNDWQMAVSVMADIATTSTAEIDIHIEGIHLDASSLIVTPNGISTDAVLSAESARILDQHWPGPTVRLRSEDQHLDMQASWSAGVGVDLQASGEVAWSDDGVAGRIELAPTEIQLADAELLSRLVPSHLDVRASGRIILAGDVTFDAAGVRPSLRLQAADVAVDVGALDLTIDGLAADLTLAGLSPLTSVGRQSVSIERFVLGDEEAQIAYRDLHANFSLEPNDMVLVDRLQLTVGDLTRLAFRSFRVPRHLSDLEYIDLIVYADEVSLDELIQSTKLKDYLQGEGQLYGRLPMRLRFDGGSVSSLTVGEGFLYGVPGGGTMAIHDEKVLGYLTQSLVIKDVRDRVSEALQDFAYTQLRLDFMKVLRDGREVIDCTLTISGSGPRGSTRPVPITINPNIYNVNDFLTNVIGLTEILRSQSIVQDRINEALERSTVEPNPPTLR